jgi:hypothetical protein
LAEENYTEEELYEMLWQKAEEIEKIPTAREINSDPFLPNYEVFVECFGNFRESEKLKEPVEKFSRLNKINVCFCNDCNREVCTGDIKICKENELADLYYDLFEKIVC